MGKKPDASWVSIETAAATFDLSVKTVRRMISRGEVDARRFGPRLVRVSVDSFVENARPLQYRGGEAK
ncbi:MAG: DNA-binding protein [Microbacterium sp.]|nr:MAG: DNA-binding protein [Microbacterium sp.]